MTVRDAAARLEVSVSTVYGLVSAGKLGCYRVGLGRGVIRFTEAHLVSYLAGTERGEQTPAPAAPTAPRLKHIHLK